MSSIHDLHDPDSENDPDYVPEEVKDSDESDDDGVNNFTNGDGVGAGEDVTDEARERRKKERDALWASFTAGPPSATKEEPVQDLVKLVKVVKRYKFAGDDIVDIVEVPEDSEDAKKWPLWAPDEEVLISDAKQLDTSNHPSKPSSSSAPSVELGTRSTATICSTTMTPPPRSVVTPSQQAPTKRPPGPRKPKTLLASSAPKPKKLSTLEKSAMDWKAHVESEAKESSEGNNHSTGSMRDELEANRRGGGYLEKVDFLDRVGARREELFEKERSLKRRKAG